MEILCGGKWHRPDGAFCKRTAKSAHRGGHFENNLMFWVERLMLAGFCCLIMVGCGTTETISPEIAERASELASLTSATRSVETKQDDTIVILKENTAALRVIETKVDSIEASLVKSEAPNGQEVIKSDKPASPENRAKDSHPASGSAAFSGGAGVSKLSMKWNIEGNWNPTIKETAEHLLQDHGFRADGMTHQQMHDHHAAIHEGRTGTTGTVVRYSQPAAECPNGRCPTSRTQRRRGLFGGLFR